MGESDFEEEEGWKDSKSKPKGKKQRETNGKLNNGASSIKERGCSKENRVPGIPALDERVIKLLRDVELCCYENAAFAKGLENWQWMIFVDWHLGADSELANRYSLSEHRLSIRQADGKWSFSSPSRGMSYYIDRAKCKKTLPKNIVKLIAAGDRRGAQDALRKAMKK